MNDGSLAESDIPSDLSDSVSEEEEEEEDEEDEDEESRKRRRERMAMKEAKRLEYNYYSRPVSFQVRIVFISFHFIDSFISMSIGSCR